MKTSLNSIARLARRGLTSSVVLIGIVASTLVGAAVYYVVNQEEDGPQIDPILAPVTQGEFVSQVLDQGEIQSSENVEIRCEVRARNGSVSVIEVIPEGTMVKSGDFLVGLDSTSFEKELETQKITMASAETAVIQANADLNVAKEARKEYVQGTFEQTMLEIDNEIADANSAIQTAKQELEQSQAVLKHSVKLAQKGFITNQQREGDEFAVEKAKWLCYAAKTHSSWLRPKSEFLRKSLSTKRSFSTTVTLKQPRFASTT